jgi:hypothetical protein
MRVSVLENQNLAGGSVSIFPSKKIGRWGEVHFFERLDRLSLPRRARRCA